MRLRSLTLTNIRRFAGQRVVVSDMRDGLNVIAGPNEFGKSTLLDALHALFFVPHTGRSGQISSLAPPSGGAIGVTLDLDHQGRAIRVTKQWLSGRMALVADAITGSPIAQGDLAERWLSDLMGDPASGPAGLIWVRQGQTGLIPDKTADRDKAVAARRTILSAIAGEVDQMTGGRRFDAVMTGVQAALADLVTMTGKPVANGAWKTTQDRIRMLTDQQTALQRAVADLSGALRDRTQAQQALIRLDDPAWVARLHQDQATAAANHTAAQDHARRLAGAAQDLKLAHLTADQARQALALHGAASLAADRAAADVRQARTDHDDLQADLAARTADAAQASANLTGADAAVRTLHDQDRAAQAALAARQAAEQLHRSQTHLDRAQAARTRLEQARARVAQNLATPARAAALDRALADLAAAHTALRASAVSLHVTHLGSARLTGPQGPLTDGAVMVTAALTLTLDGALRLTVDPGAPRGQAAADLVATAERARDALLQQMGAAGVADARRLADQQARDMSAASTAATEYETLAPQGLDPLMADVARLAERAAQVGDDVPAPAPADLIAAQDRLTAARGTAATTAAAQTKAALAAHGAATLLAQLTQIADAATARRGDAAASAATTDDLTRQLAQLQTQAILAQERHDSLQAAAPDQTLTGADLQRATAALAAHAQDRETAGKRIAAATGTITARADDAVQEQLDAVTGQLAALAQQDRALAAEVAALTHLRDTLTAVRADQRSAYFGPIQSELAPLLDLLHGQAALSFDPAALTPGHLTRAGLQEPIDSLSGGTQEQIAILTRLAFARLLTRAGRPAPVILDDALVFSDDDRIARMFTALHHVAADQQIIVLTCRQLAFQRLGGHRPVVTIEDWHHGDRT